ncbi:sirohydrochlorin chelatase [Wenjunlia tyrosinilytica]|uniref:Sirohydrochlorin chelatase n=1 Tax=Wenjunlia tyrosinilytica TaxID=1544741 RepID=A0A917ZU52_9ACTN|nr:sirohydrochlorin chelatase [Wenjunlia tyrosinilytica]GGO92263.1 sirohydrochlorin chelatase [Wenjunlia tyrosinilytica]
MNPVLVIIAHGSRDPRHAETVRSLTARVRRLRPGLRVETGFLDHCGPGVGQVLDRLAAQGRREVVALPLLLTRAFHAKADIPQVLDLASARNPGLDITRAWVLGPSPLLQDALDRRLREAGVWPGERSTGVVLASAGSSDPEAVAVIAEVAREWRRTGWCAVVPAFASARGPRTEEAVERLRRDGVEHIAVAPYVLAPGFLPDRIVRGARAAGADTVADVLGDAPEVARLLLARFDEARVAQPAALSA